jgi:hypothetical protein
MKATTAKADKQKQKASELASNDAKPIQSEAISTVEMKPIDTAGDMSKESEKAIEKLSRRMAGVEIDIEIMAKAMNDAKSLAGDLQSLAEKAGLGRSIETINGGKLKVPTPAVLNDLVSLPLMGSDKAKAKTKADKVKALLNVLRGLESLGVIKR